MNRIVKAFLVILLLSGSILAKEISNIALNRPYTVNIPATMEISALIPSVTKLG